MIIQKMKKVIKDGLSKLFGFKHLYYFVPQCPVCEGWHTGRYVGRMFSDTEYMERKSLENGELIRIVSREPIRNCFCEDCGFEWGAHIETKWLTEDELLEQKYIRGTNEKFTKYKNRNYINGKPPKPSAFNRWFM